MNPCQALSDADAELLALLERQIEMDLRAVRDLKLYAATHENVTAFLRSRFPEFFTEGDGL